MRKLEEYNPIVIFVYFLIVTGFAMFIMDPVILGLSLLGSLTLFFMIDGFHGAASHITALAFFVVMAIVNPLFNHNGVTILFFLNNNPITLEALIYGIASSAMIISVVYRFRSFSKIMTSDKMLYLFGALSPKFSLIISMSLRYIPMFVAQTKKINRSQKALGLYKEDNALDTIKGGLRVFSVMTTWALENGIITADSMSARGYGTGRRTFFSIFRFRKNDIIFLAATLALFGVFLAGAIVHALDFTYYPAIGKTDLSVMSVLSYITYALLSFLPVLAIIKDNIKWKYFLSKT